MAIRKAPGHAPRWCSGIAAAVALLVATSAASAQQTGSVAGEVRDRATGQPLNGVQLSVRGTSRGTLTDARGRFVIPGVPAGAHTVDAVFIGYRTEQQQVTVAAGETAEVTFQLGISAVSLEEVIVTGTGGAAARRELGASVASVNVANVQEKVAVADVGAVLQARIPGVRSLGTVGGVGASKDLRIRGMSSFTLGQRPVVYIDGVRVDTRQTEWGGGVTGSITTCCSFSGGAGEDRLSDLNPNDIERIEIVKGPAAGTLYGSEGTNGVIQIFTKKGRSDSAPRWTAAVTTGFQRYRPNFETKFYPRFTGQTGLRGTDANELIESGLYQSYDMTVQGGGNSVTYFVSGGYLDEDGSIQPNGQKRGNLRLNLHWLANQKLSFDVTSAYTRSKISSLQSGNNWTSLLGNAILAVPYNSTDERPLGEPWVPVHAIQEIDTFDDTNRWTGGLTVAYNVSDRFTNRFQIGLDAVNEEKLRFYTPEFEYTYIPAGEKDIGYRNARIVTADYLGTLSFDISERLGNQFSFGAQGFWDTERRNFAVGTGFAAPGVSTVNGATLTQGAEWFNEEIQLGVYGQNRLAWNDKVFVTTGVRLDGNSAFGDNYGLQVYPNAQLSYDLGSEGFLPSFMSQARVRGAVGRSGLAPGAFDKFLTFAPLTVLDDEAGVRPNNPGNLDLKPETTTEIEGGFELGFLRDRVGIEVTAYRAITKDALAQVTMPPSSNFGGNPQVNIGTIKNVGWETSLRVTAIEGRSFRWTTDLRMDGNRNEVTDLGRDPVTDTIIKSRGLAGGGTVRLGYPVRTRNERVPCTTSWRDRRTVNIVDLCDGRAGFDPATITHTRSDTAVYIGPTLPTFNVSLGNEIGLGAFRFYGLVTAEKGAYFNNSDRPYRARFRTGDEYLSTLDYSKCRADAMCVESEMRTFQSDSLFNFMNLFNTSDKRDNIRIRELSVAYNLAPALTSRLGLGTTTLTLSAKNVHWWDDCNCMDPNMTYLGGASFGEQQGFLAMPTARQFLLNVRTSF